MTATASQAWAILKRHARDEINTLRLQDLCKDNDRVSSLVAVHNSNSNTNSSNEPEGGSSNMLLADLSRQRMTLETLNHLLRLSVARGVRNYITRLAWGQNNPEYPVMLQMANTNEQQQQRRRGGGGRGSRNNSSSSHNYHHHNHQDATNKATRFEGNDQTPITSINNNHHNSTEQQKDTEHTGTTTAAAGGASNIQNNNNNIPAVMPSMHLALRAPKDQGLHMLTIDGVNALTAIHRDWDRLERLSDSIRRGAWRGSTGAMMRDVVVVGRGVAVQALQFVYQALCHDEAAIMARKFGLEDPGSSSSTASRLIRRGLSVSGGSSSNTAAGSGVYPRRIHFLTSVDPLAAASMVSELDAASTMVISLALQGNEETGLATKTMKSWLLQQLGSSSSSAQALSAGGSSSSSRKADNILSKHMLLITGNDQIAQSINKPESVFVIPEHSRCEPFLSFSSATLLPLSIVFGWSICEQFLAGAHDLDCHFVETNPRHNLPVLLALTDVWNDVFLGNASSGRIVTPYTQAMKAFPAYVAALEAQTCSGPPMSATTNHNNVTANPNQLSCSSLVLDGGTDSAYDRSLYQSSKIQNSELVMVMNTQLQANTMRNLGAQGMNDVLHHADALICSLFGHVDEMAFGAEGAEDSNNNNNHLTSLADSPTSHQSPLTTDTNNSRSNNQSTSKGNRPSTLLMVSTLDAFACGQLIALSEHRAVIKARIWDIDPFTQENGSSLKTARTDQLREDLQKIFQNDNYDDDENEDNEEGMNLSTKTILGHYANLTRDQRVHAK